MGSGRCSVQRLHYATARSSSYYYAPAYANFGACVTYQRNLFRDRIDWRLLVNVQNVFAKNTIYPLVTVDTRDGRHTADVAVYTLKETRTFQFTRARSGLEEN